VVELGHEIAVGVAGGVEVVGSFLELLAQVENRLFEFGDPGPWLGRWFCSWRLARSASRDCLLAAVDAGLVSGAAARAWIWARRSW
jgi:hypothetical protein